MGNSSYSRLMSIATVIVTICLAAMFSLSSAVGLALLSVAAIVLQAH